MRVTINIEVEPKITYELEQYVKSELPHIINENLFEDRKELNRLIQECVKGQIKANINDLMQGKDFREFLRDRIAENIGMKEKPMEFTEAVNKAIHEATFNTGG